MEGEYIEMKYLDRVLDVVKILNMVTENPQLPIVAWVDEEICALGDGGCMRWQGSIDFGSARIIEFAYHNEKFVEREDAWDKLSDRFDENLTDEEIEDKINALPWVRAIAVDVNMPQQGQDNGRRIY